MLFFRRRWPCRWRRYRQRQTNWTRRHFGSAASVNFPGHLVARPEKTPTSSKRSNQAPSRVRGLSALFHAGGPQTSRGDTFERPRHPGSLTFVTAIPESTYRAGKTRTTAEKSGGRPRQPAQLGYLFGGTGHPEGDTQTCAKQSNQVPP